MSTRLASVLLAHTTVSATHDRQVKRRRLLKRASPVASFSTLPVEVLANILSRLPHHTHFRLSKVSAAFQAAVRTLHYKRLQSLDLIPHAKLSDGPPCMQGAGNALDNPLYLHLAAHELRIVRLHRSVPGELLSAFMQRLAQTCPQIENLSFFDCGVVDSALGAMMGMKLARLNELEVGDAREHIFSQFVNFPTIRRLSLPALRPSQVPALIAFLACLPSRMNNLIDLSISISETNEKSVEDMVTLLLNFLITNARDKFFSLKQFSISIFGMNKKMKSFTRTVTCKYSRGESLFPTGTSVQLEYIKGFPTLFPARQENCIDPVYSPVQMAISIKNLYQAAVRNCLDEMTPTLESCTTLHLSTQYWTTKYGNLDACHEKAILCALERHCQKLDTLHVGYAFNSNAFAGTPRPHRATFSLLMRILSKCPQIQRVKLSREIIEHAERQVIINFLKKLDKVRTLHLKDPGPMYRNSAQDRNRLLVKRLPFFFDCIAGLDTRLECIYMEESDSLLYFDYEPSKYVLKGAMQAVISFEQSKPNIDISTIRAQIEKWINLHKDTYAPRCPYLS